MVLLLVHLPICKCIGQLANELVMTLLMLLSRSDEYSFVLLQKPFSFIGFGGGRHGCMGTNFAYLQIKTILSVMLRNFEMKLVDPFPEPDYTSMVVAPKPCRIHFKRRQLLSPSQA